MTKLNTIQSFLEPKEMAICGVSRNTKKFGRVVYDSLKEKGFTLYPVNPNTSEINGDTCFRDVSELPDHVQYMLIVTPKKQTKEVIEKAIGRGIKNIWIQQMSDSKEAVKELEESGINYITKECILMHYKPSGIHKFHKVIRKFFGRHPK